MMRDKDFKAFLPQFFRRFCRAYLHDVPHQYHLHMNFACIHGLPMKGST